MVEEIDSKSEWDSGDERWIKGGKENRGLEGR